MSFQVRQTTLSLVLIILSLMATVSLIAAVTWSDETRLTTDPNSDWRPSVAQMEDGKIWVLWHSYRTGLADLFYKTSSDNGLSWSPDTRLTFDPDNDAHPAAMQTSNGTIWVVWTSNRTGNFDLFYKTSSDNGESWSTETQLTTHLDRDILPSITLTDDGRTWVAWMSTRTGNDDLFYKTSSDNGLTWTDDLQLTQDLDDDRAPSITQTRNGTIWIVWASNRPGNFEIFYKTSSNGGMTWSAETRLTKKPDFDLFPSIAQAKDDTTWVVWDSDRISYRGEPQDDLFYSVYDGVSWSSDTQLTTNDTDDIMPSITQGNSDLWVVWTSDRMGNYEIFSKAAFIPVHDIAVIDLTTSPTEAFIGEIVSINVTIENQGDYIENFNVSTYYTRISDPLIGTQNITLAKGANATLTFEWTPNMTGNYEILANTTEIQGDVDPADNTFTTIIYLRYGSQENLRSESLEDHHVWAFIFGLLATILIVPEFRKYKKRFQLDTLAIDFKNKMLNNTVNMWQDHMRRKII